MERKLIYRFRTPNSRGTWIVNVALAPMSLAKELSKFTIFERDFSERADVTNEVSVYSLRPSSQRHHCFHRLLGDAKRDDTSGRPRQVSCRPFGQPDASAAVDLVC